jgi:enoyl-CoA hydratase/carnithine racemase
MDYPWYHSEEIFVDTVLYEKKDRIAYITLNRPMALNALNDDLNRELWDV